ncbi:hypothetical protein [Tateyamaria omphalii]|uniref:hypothetical protein n=1 Tax=Tateyamaria omphalii TaxID=299262 RepID=UPI001674D35F|nr:hypothetical protein [Tateyamaria omphalii]
MAFNLYYVKKSAWSCGMSPDGGRNVRERMPFIWRSFLRVANVHLHMQLTSGFGEQSARNAGGIGHSMVQKVSKRASGSDVIAAAKQRIRALRLAMSLLVMIAVSLTLISEAQAQSASFRSVDTNSDRMLSFDELVAAFGRDGARQLMRTTDHNGDNMITIGEIRRGSRAEPERGTSRRGSSGDDGDDDDDDDRDERDDDDDDNDGDNDGGDSDGGGGDDGGGDDGGGDDGGGDDDD